MMTTKWYVQPTAYSNPLPFEVATFRSKAEAQMWRNYLWTVHGVRSSLWTRTKEVKDELMEQVQEVTSPVVAEGQN